MLPPPAKRGVGIRLDYKGTYPSRQAAFSPNNQDFCWIVPPSRCLDAVAHGGNPQDRAASLPL
ncbi:MAG: hypothetical protein F6J90_10655 [Moorea sp. SIOASIH]|uniref:hypothetical protein n=1 Tax=Moorena sp. SIOASIH TaxID=2607817 RepID=UPI0013BBFD4B|nr:hypothetical protein [Moorena sp. SIOASIH]NEO36750.1 hypothetical protein [Moorena sp. SIOASIH]